MWRARDLTRYTTCRAVSRPGTTTLPLGRKTWGSNSSRATNPPEDVLVVAYSLEDGLRDFYLSMMDKSEQCESEGHFPEAVRHRNQTQGTRLRRISQGDRKNRICRAISKKTWLPRPLKAGSPPRNTSISFSLILNPRSTSFPWPCPSKPRPWIYTSVPRTTPGTKRARPSCLQIANEETAHLSQLGRLMEDVA